MLYEHVLVLWLSTNQDTGVQTTQKICKGTKFLKSYSVFCKCLLLRQSVQKAQNSANCSVLQTQCPVQCTDNVRYTELSTHIAQPFMHTVECTQSTHCSGNACCAHSGVHIAHSLYLVCTQWTVHIAVRTVGVRGTGSGGAVCGQ